MPNIEEFIKTIKREQAAYVPIAELGIHPLIKEKVLGRPVSTLKDDIDFWSLAGYDYIKIQPGADFNPANMDMANEKAVSLDLANNFNWANEGNGAINSIEEFENYTFPGKDDFDYGKFDNVEELLPSGMGVVGQYGDIFTMTWEMMGFESFSFALFENTGLIKQLNDTLGELVYSMFEVMAQHDAVDVLFYSDDIAYTNGLMMPPDVLDKYFFPWLKRIGELAKYYNKPFIYHTDGILYNVMDKIIACGVDALHPIEPKAMKLSELKEKYGNQLSFIGHVEVDVLARGSKDDIKKIVKENIELFDQYTGYCVGSSNSIPAYVNVENYLAMIHAAKEFGKFN